MHKQEEMLWEMLVEADINRYPTTCSIDSTQRCNAETIEKFGLCDFHSYTMLQARPVQLQEGGKDFRYMLQLRNPWGNKEWLGPWSDHSSTWKTYEFANR